MTDDDFFTRCQQQEARRSALAAELREATKAQLFDALHAAGIARVTVTFDGHGDSGQIEDTAAVAAGGKPVDLPDGQLAIRTAKPDGSGPEAATLTVSEIIESLCYELLHERWLGWQDGDGAFGEFVFDVADRTLQLTMNERFSDFDTSTHMF